MSIPVDVLAFAPHPDDAELFCGGTLIALADKGYKTAVVDCSRGELATSGSVKERDIEASCAAEIMKLSLRRNLELPDGRIDPYSGAGGAESERQLRAAVSAIRSLQPKLILIPATEGRHPDHSAASTLLDRAVFFSGLRQFKADSDIERHVCKQVIYYMMRYCAAPSFVVDTSAAFERKVQAISAYKSQITPPAAGSNRETLINSPRTISTIDARDRFYGAMIGVEHGEPFVVRNALALNDPVQHFAANPTDQALLFPGAL